MNEIERIYQTINAVSTKLNDVMSRLDSCMNIRVEEITPYTETKTAYYLEKEKTFYDVPNGNLTVYFDNYNGSYSVSRIANRVTVSFDTLTESTNITISVN